MARYFVTFHTNCSLSNKLMVFTDLTRQEVWDNVTKEYPEAIDTIYSEPEASRLLSHIYGRESQWVQFGTECELYSKDINTGKVTTELLATYPVSFNKEEPSNDEEE